MSDAQTSEVINRFYKSIESIKLSEKDPSHKEPLDMFKETVQNFLEELKKQESEAPPVFASSAPIGGVSVYPISPGSNSSEFSLSEEIQKKWNELEAESDLSFDESFLDSLIKHDVFKAAVKQKIKDFLWKKRNALRLEDKGFKPNAYSILKEMFASERSFLDSLSEFKKTAKGYRDYSSKMPNDKMTLFVTAFPGIKKEDITESLLNVFDNFLRTTDKIIESSEEILMLEKEVFLKEEDGDRLKVDALDNVISQLNPKVKALASNCLEAIKIYETLSGSVIGGHRFDERAAKREKSVKGKSFSDILIQPVQRIPRWVMLSNELVKTLPDNSKVKGVTETFHFEISAAALQVNHEIGISDINKLSNAFLNPKTYDAQFKKIFYGGSNPDDAKIVTDLLKALKSASLNGYLDAIEPTLLAKVISKFTREQPESLSVTLEAPPMGHTQKQLAKQLSDLIRCGFEIKFHPETAMKQWRDAIGRVPVVISSPVPIDPRVLVRIQNHGLFLKQTAGFEITADVEFKIAIQKSRVMSEDIKKFWQGIEVEVPKEVEKKTEAETKTNAEFLSQQVNTTALDQNIAAEPKQNSPLAEAEKTPLNVPSIDNEPPVSPLEPNKEEAPLQPTTSQVADSEAATTVASNLKDPVVITAVPEAGADDNAKNLVPNDAATEGPLEKSESALKISAQLANEGTPPNSPLKSVMEPLPPLTQIPVSIINKRNPEPRTTDLFTFKNLQKVLAEIRNFEHELEATNKEQGKGILYKYTGGEKRGAKKHDAVKILADKLRDILRASDMATDNPRSIKIPIEVLREKPNLKPKEYVIELLKEAQGQAKNLNISTKEESFQSRVDKTTKALGLEKDVKQSEPLKPSRNNHKDRGAKR